MCRYGINSYKPHYACFKCRKTFKRRLLIDIDLNAAKEKVWEHVPYKCPQCSHVMANMGLDFESPKKTDQKAWKHIESLFTSGITFHSCGCSGPGYIPKDKEKLIEYLTEKKQIYIAHRRFWSGRIEPKNESEKHKDWNKNWCFIVKLPNDFYTGTRKNRKTDLKKAVAFWTDKVVEIEQYLKQLNA